MAKDPAFLFYPNDYIGGTMGMTFEEKGAYMELLMVQFNRGHMTYDMIRQVLGQNCGQLFGRIKDKFSIDDDGLYYNTRLEEEKYKRQNFSNSRRNNKLGINQHTKKDKLDDSNSLDKEGHMTLHMENENENTILSNKAIKYINIDFEIFWDLYDKKVGNKEKLKVKWERLTDEERELAMKHIPRYKQSQSDKQFRKDPQTYLNNKSFNDEIVGLKDNHITHEAQPQETEWWKRKYGHIYETIEQFNEAYEKGIIDPFND